MDYILMIIFGIGLIALVAALVLTVKLILAKKEKRRKMKGYKIAAVVSALLVPTTVMAVIYCRPLIDQSEGITPFLERLPSLAGRSYEECKEEYSDKFELIVEGEEYSFDYPAGTIIYQTPFEGSQYLPGNTTVKCVISKGVRMADAADVVGLDFEDAKEFLESGGKEPDDTE